MELPISRTTLENPESDRGIIATTTRRSASGGIEAILKLETSPEILGVINPTILPSTASSSTIAQTSLLTTFDSTMIQVRWSGRVMNVGIDPIGQKRMSVRQLRIPTGVVATSETSS